MPNLIPDHVATVKAVRKAATALRKALASYTDATATMAAKGMLDATGANPLTPASLVGDQAGLTPKHFADAASACTLLAASVAAPVAGAQATGGKISDVLAAISTLA